MEFENLEDALLDMIRRANKLYCYPFHQEEKDITLWNLVSMLRGPDENLVTQVKWLTVSRLRSVVGVRNRYLDVNHEPLSDSQRYLRDKILKEASTHFNQHWDNAINSVRKMYNYDLTEDKEMVTEEVKEESKAEPSLPKKPKKAQKVVKTTKKASKKATKKRPRSKRKARK